MKLTKKNWIIIFSSVLIIIAALISAYYIFGNKRNDVPQTQKQQVKQLWTCTMHPQVISDKPGQCPICGMDLVKKNSGDDTMNQDDMKNMIKLNDNKLILADVSTVKVQLEDIDKQLTAYSYIDFAEQNRKVITAKFNGRIEKLYVNKTGEHISKGSVLFEIYSPDLVQAQNEYLISSDVTNSDFALRNSVRKKLLIFGMTDDQISELEKTRVVKMTVKYHSPVSGTVIEKKVQEGMYVSEGTTLFDVADLSSVWNIAEVFEEDLNVISVGSRASLTVQSAPGEEFIGRVSYIYPVVNPQSRTVKVRSEFSNRSGKLRPQTYGEVRFSRNFGKGLMVPSDAVLFLGKRNVVWLKAGDGMFEPREVTIGMKINDKYQILSGISQGDEIALTGGFLIDSESQLKSGMGTGQQHDEKPPGQLDKNNSGQQNNENHKNHGQ